MLYTHLFNKNLSSPTHISDISKSISDITLNWAIHGGIVSISLRWSGSFAAAYDFYQRYVGYRIVLLDQFCDTPVADGFIVDLGLGVNSVNILCNGFWWRHTDQLYNFDTTTKDDNQGALTYNPAANSFQDDGQDFSAWESSPAPSLYEIDVINNDNTQCNGYLGAAFTTSGTDDSIYVYQDWDLTTPGWNGEDPTSKTPSSYSITLCYNYWTNSDVVKDCLSEVSAISTDQSNIDEAGTVIGFWETPWEEGGMYPSEAIEKMASFSDSSNNQWGYWCKNQPLNGTLPQKPLPYFKAQVNDGTFDWDVRKWMIKSGSDAATRNIQELRNHVRIAYRDLEDEGNLAMYPEIGALEDTDSISAYWQRETIISGGDSYEETAALYGALYLNKYKDALLGKPLTLTSPYILDSYGNKWPLWYPIKLSKSYFKLTDLFPDVNIIDESWNRKTASQAVQMEYSAASNELRVFLDTESNELDALVARMDAFR